MVLQRKWQASRGAKKGRGVGCALYHAAPAPTRRARTRDDDAATLTPVAASDTLPARRYGAGVQAIIPKSKNCKNEPRAAGSAARQPSSKQSAQPCQ